MRLATFDIRPELAQGLATGDVELVACDPVADGDQLPVALEATEASLEAAAADVALIAGSGSWALAAALACAKAVVPYAYLRDSDASADADAGHVERLAAGSVAPSGGAAAVHDWLASLGAQ